MNEINKEVIEEIKKAVIELHASAESTHKLTIYMSREQVNKEEIIEFITQEVTKAVDFYSFRNKINSEQYIEIKRRAIEYLVKNKVTSENQIKHIVKDYIIHVLYRELSFFK